MDNLIITTQLLNQILGYLGTRPYQEVHHMIESLQSEAKNQPTQEAPSE